MKCTAEGERGQEASRLIALVEDDADVARVIEQTLADFSLATVWFRSGGDLLRRLVRLAPDLCIIDLGLPDMDGLDLMQRVRELSPCGILILTGRTHVSDRVMGLELGADDYVLKPFEPRELVARINAIMRRVSGRLPAGAAAASTVRFKGWTLEREGDDFRVRGKRVERVVAMTDLQNPEAVDMLQRTLGRMGVLAALEQAGVESGDTVHFGTVELEWE